MSGIANLASWPIAASGTICLSRTVVDTRLAKVVRLGLQLLLLGAICSLAKAEILPNAPSQRIFDWSFVAGHAVYAGASAFDGYETARNLGTCAFEGNPDLGPNPSMKALAIHHAVEFGAVLAGDAALKWIGKRQGIPRWLNAVAGNMAAAIGTGKHLQGGMQWVRLCR